MNSTPRGKPALHQRSFHSSAESGLPIVPSLMLGSRLAEVDQLIRRLPSTPNGHSRSALPAGARQYLPAAEGEGHWDMIRLGRGLFLSITDATYRSATRLHLAAEPMFKIRVLLSGALMNEEGLTLAEAGDVSLQSTTRRAGASYRVAPTREPLRMVVVHVKPQALAALGFAPDALAVLGASGEARASQQEGGITAISGGHAFRRIAQDIFASLEALSADIRMRYLAAKAEELLCCALQAVRPNPVLRLAGNRIRTRDQARLRQAREILSTRLDDPPTIPQLARLIGLNETKLKVGFKQTFGEPPHTFVARLRQDLALQLVETTDLSFAEIAYRVGFQFPANFSQAFRREFGLSPRAARQAARGANGGRS